MVVALTASVGTGDECEGVVTRVVREGLVEHGGMMEGSGGEQNVNLRGDEAGGEREGEREGGAREGGVVEQGEGEVREKEEDVLGLERRLCGVLNDMALVEIPTDTVAERLWQLSKH